MELRNSQPHFRWYELDFFIQNFVVEVLLIIQIFAYHVGWNGEQKWLFRVYIIKSVVITAQEFAQVEMRRCIITHTDVCELMFEHTQGRRPSWVTELAN